MYIRIKKSGNYEYLQICESKREGKKVRQRVIATIGRLDHLKAKGEVENLVRSLAKYSEQVLIVLGGKSDPSALSYKIGPSLIFERLWQKSGIKAVINKFLSNRKYSFSVERALFLTVLHRLLISGSDRFCYRWHRDYQIEGVEGLELHHLYRAMGWLGEVIAEQKDSTPFSPRRMKDLIEEELFFRNRDLFSGLDLVFFDTTSLYFEGAGGRSIGKKGKNKDHRPDLNQMVVGVVLNDSGRPLCCEMWPGNTTDVKSLIPVMDRIGNRFLVKNFCVVADRGMISQETIDALGQEGRRLPYILGARMRKVKEIRGIVAAHQDITEYREVYPESLYSKAPAPLKVKEVWQGERRYILCYNSKQARKDAMDREAIIESLQEKLQSDAKSLIGNKGYRKYLKINRESVQIDEEKINSDAIYDGKWVLQSNMDWSAEQIALKYKELWQVEYVFRDLKSSFNTRPIFHQRDETILGHVFCSFLALVLRKELERLLEEQGYNFEWAEIKQDLSALQETIIEENGKTLKVRSKCQGVCGQVFQAVGVAIPSTIREA
jgi:transposase